MRKAKYNKKESETAFNELNLGSDIIEEGEDFDTNYGVNYFKITDEQIQALNEGKVVWVDIMAEYALLIKKEEK